MLVIDTGVFRGALLHCGSARHKHDWSHVIRVKSDIDFITVTSTDGVTSFRYRTSNPGYEVVNITIHKDIIKLAIQQKLKSISIEKFHNQEHGTDYFLLNGSIGFETSHNLPDIERLIPENRSFGYPQTGEQLHFDFALLNKCQESMRLATGRKDAFAFLQYPIDKSTIGLVRLKDSDTAICLLAGLIFP